MKKINLTLFILLSFFVNAQRNAVDYNMWYQYLLNAKLDDKMTLTTLAQYRSFDLLLDSRLFVSVAYVDYSITDKISVGAGGMYLILESYGSNNQKRKRTERRALQQININDKIGRTSLTHRFRIEERFLDNPDTFIVRLRYLASFKIPLNKSNQKQINYAILKNEVRMAARREKPFDSNRITVGLGFNLSKKSAIEIGLINQMSEFRTSNYLNVGFRNKLDWSKKKTKESDVMNDLQEIEID